MSTWSSILRYYLSNNAIQKKIDAETTVSWLYKDLLNGEDTVNMSGWVHNRRRTSQMYDRDVHTVQTQDALRLFIAISNRGPTA